MFNVLFQSIVGPQAGKEIVDTYRRASTLLIPKAFLSSDSEQEEEEVKQGSNVDLDNLNSNTIAVGP